MPFISSVRGNFGPQGKIKNRVGKLGYGSVGGTVSISGGYRIHTFQTGSISGGSFIFEPDESGTVEYLIVAGGGGGGAAGGTDGSGGGGAGGLLTGTFNVSAQQYSIVVGNGGAQHQGTAGNHNPANYNGGNSSAFSLTAIGGGSASSESGVTRTASNGGCGGGAGGYSGTRGTGTPGQGYDGGACAGPGDGGGGGTTAPGGNGQSSNGSTPRQSGGAGMSVFGTNYGGGGGASGDPRTNSGQGGSGGSGGGGRGMNCNSGDSPGSGENGKGGGGGGAAGTNASGVTRYPGAGGSGIIIIRYQL